MTQQLLVALLVFAALSFSAWKLMPARRRVRRRSVIATTTSYAPAGAILARRHVHEGRQTAVRIGSVRTLVDAAAPR